MSALQRFGTLCISALLSIPCGAVALPLPHLELDVAVDPHSREIRAVARLAASAETRFPLHHALSIHSVTADGVATRATHAPRRGALQEWHIDAKPGTALRIEYGGVLPPLDPALDHRRVLGDMPPMSAPAGTFLPAASGWYPRPYGAFSYRVNLSLPHDQRGLAPGRLLTEDPPRGPGERYRATFAFDHPSEGIDLMAGPFVVRERIVPREGAAPLRLRTYFDRELDALADAYLADSERYINLYSRMIGAYPFTEFSIVASPLPTGFGMPTLTYIGAQVLKLPFIRATSLGHEVLHNWWGNGVYPDYASGNWSEGLTTFMADYLYKERESAAAAREMRLGWLRDLAAVPAGSHRPLSAFRSRTHGVEAALGYGKAAMVFLMLRDLIGEEAFERGLRMFWERHRFRVASWEDMRRAFEESGGRPLDTFFTQWIRRAGAPDPAIVAASTRTEQGAVRLTLDLRQASPPYALRVPVEIVTGERSAMRWVEFDADRRSVTLPLDAAPDGVRLDPELRLWRTLEQSALPPILRQWIIARAPRLAVVSSAPDVQQAAQLLARSFFEMPARESKPAEAARGGDPLLIIGLHHDIDAALVKLGLPARPPAFAGHGTAQAWTVRRQDTGAADSTPLAIVSARDAASLSALARPLPHYGAQSYVVFEGARAIDRGTWPASIRPIVVDRSSR